jgi:hypothetical protein
MRARSCSVNEFIEYSLTGHQFIVSSNLSNCARPHNCDTIESADGVQTMCHGDYSALPFQQPSSKS